MLGPWKLALHKPLEGIQSSDLLRHLRPIKRATSAEAAPFRITLATLQSRKALCTCCAQFPVWNYYCSKTPDFEISEDSFPFYSNTPIQPIKHSFCESYITLHLRSPNFPEPERIRIVCTWNRFHSGRTGRLALSGSLNPTWLFRSKHSTLTFQLKCWIINN